MGQNPSWDMCKPGDQLQETSDFCDCQQGFCHQVLSHVLRRGQIQLNANQFITFLKCIFLDFVVILFLTVQINLPLKLQTDYFFVSGKTYRISRESNNFFPHCNLGVFQSLITFLLTLLINDGSVSQCILRYRCFPYGLHGLESNGVHCYLQNKVTKQNK